MLSNEDYEKWVKRVTEATKMVAAPYSIQKGLFPQNFPTADEIALNFNDEVVLQADYLLENGLLTEFQYKKIKELSEKFTQMSNDSHNDYWTLKALEVSEDWEQCRIMARVILNEFDKSH